MTIRKEFREGIATRHASLAWVLFAALASAPLMFVAVCWVLIAPVPGTLVGLAGPQPLPAFLLPALGGMAILAAASGIAVRRWATPARLAKAGTKSAGSSALVEPKSEDERQLAAAVQRYQVALMVSLALLEATSIFGFVLSFFSQDLRYVLGLSTLALMVDIILLRPDGTIYDRLAKAVMRA